MTELTLISLENGDVRVCGDNPATILPHLSYYDIVRPDPLIIRPRYPFCVHKEYIYKKLNCGKGHGTHRCKKYHKTTTVPDCLSCIAKNENK